MTTLLHLQHASLEAFDTNAQVTADLNDIFATLPDVAGFTEVTRKGHRDELVAVAKRHGYIVRGGDGDTALAMPVGTLGKAGSIFVHAGSSTDPAGSYGPRYIDWVTVDIRGEWVSVCEFHAIRPKNAARQRLHRLTFGKATDWMAAKSEGKELAFLMCDANESARPTLGAPAGSQLRNAGITTIYDELRTYPPTGPSDTTIDWIASVDADARVSAAGLFVHKPGNSDHRRVSAFYNVRGAS